MAYASFFIRRSFWHSSSFCVYSFLKIKRSVALTILAAFSSFAFATTPTGPQQVTSSSACDSQNSSGLTRCKISTFQRPTDSQGGTQTVHFRYSCPVGYRIGGASTQTGTVYGTEYSWTSYSLCDNSQPEQCPTETVPGGPIQTDGPGQYAVGGCLYSCSANLSLLDG